MGQPLGFAWLPSTILISSQDWVSEITLGTKSRSWQNILRSADLFFIIASALRQGGNSYEVY